MATEDEKKIYSNDVHCVRMQLIPDPSTFGEVLQICGEHASTSARLGIKPVTLEWEEIDEERYWREGVVPAIRFPFEVYGPLVDALSRRGFKSTGLELDAIKAHLEDMRTLAGFTGKTPRYLTQ